MYRRMQYFAAVVETGSFSEAAEACHISQSAISQQIKALEDELQVSLLDRRGRRFELTPAGAWFYKRAKRQLAEMDSAVREARRIATGERKRLRVGVLTGFSARVTQNAVSDFVSAHPNVMMSLAAGTHEAIFRQVMEGQLDMVVNDQRRALADHFVNVELGEQPLYAMLRQDDPLARHASLALEELGHTLCILAAPQAQRENEAGYWRDVMGFPGDLLFADDLETACLNAVAGVGWMPCDGDMSARAGTALVPLHRGDAPLKRRMFAFWLESADAPLHWELAEALTRHFI